MRFLYLYIIILFVLIGKGQNLVPNPSFETYTLCPNAGGQITSAIPWNAATTNSSTDYFNACRPGFPNNSIGYQNSRTGNAYAGLYFFGGNIREYLQVQLNTSLLQDKTYYIEFFVSLADHQMIGGCNNIAANISITRPFTSTFGVLQSLTPHIMIAGNPILIDTVNWIKISGCYTAQGGEEYITIGNFFDDSHTQITGTTTASYYFVDDVLVEEITSPCVTGLNEVTLDNTVSLLPNPANGLLSVNSTYEISIIELSNIAGQLLLSEQVHSKTHQLQVDGLAEGIYFVKLIYPNGLSITRKLIKQ